MQEMRATADAFNSSEFPGARVLIGETYLPNIAGLAKMYGSPEKPEFQLPMDTQVGFINKMDVAKFRAKTDRSRRPRSAAMYRCWSLTTTTTRGSMRATATVFTTPTFSA